MKTISFFVILGFSMLLSYPLRAQFLDSDTGFRVPSFFELRKETVPDESFLQFHTDRLRIFQGVAENVNNNLCLNNEGNVGIGKCPTSNSFYLLDIDGPTQTFDRLVIRRSNLDGVEMETSASLNFNKGSTNYGRIISTDEHLSFRAGPVGAQIQNNALMLDVPGSLYVPRALHLGRGNASTTLPTLIYHREAGENADKPLVIHYDDVDVYNWGAFGDGHIFSSTLNIGIGGNPLPTIDQSNGIVLFNGRNLKFDGGINQAIVFENQNGPRGNIGVEMDTSLIVFANKTNLQLKSTDYIDLSIDDNSIMKLNGDGNIGLGVSNPQYLLSTAGAVNINEDNTGNTALLVKSSQAIWYNNGQFSWGFGGDWNRFADPIHIGGSQAPASGVGLIVDEKVAIGTQDPGPYQLKVDGNIDITGELTAASDVRLKKDILDIQEALRVVAQLQPKTYYFETHKFPSLDLPGGQKMGFIAQELESILPDLVKVGGLVTDAKGHNFNSKSINYIEMIPLLTKAIQEQQEIIEKQQSEISDFENQLEKIRTEVSFLKEQVIEK